MTFFDSLDISGGHLIAWSDSCTGQNKNFFILCLWQYLISTKKFTIIDHKFPESGHSFLDSDRDFLKVEKLIKKRENIYSVNEYHEIFKKSQLRSPPVVTRMSQKFLSLKEFPMMMNFSNKQVNTDGEKIGFRDGIRWIRVKTVGEYNYKNSFNDDEPWKTVITGTEFEPVDPLIRTETTRPVAEKKLCDLRKQLPYIPISFRAFYMNISSTNAVDSDITDDEISTESDVLASDSGEKKKNIVTVLRA